MPDLAAASFGRISRRKEAQISWLLLTCTLNSQTLLALAATFRAGYRAGKLGHTSATMVLKGGRSDTSRERRLRFMSGWGRIVPTPIEGQTKRLQVVTTPCIG